MPSFGKTSKERLETCHPKLQLLFNEVVKRYDCTILCGHRNQADQDKAFAEGKSKLKWPKGEHNALPSKAVDVAPYITGKDIDWNNTKQFYHFAGYVLATAEQLGLNIRCGCDWDKDKDVDDQTFNDLVHFEIDE